MARAAPCRGHPSGLGDVLYKELWCLCAGSPSVPREGERVYYNLQALMDQLDASTHQGLGQPIPSFNPPSKVLCLVTNVQLGAERDTDEPYACFTLIPEPPNQREVTSPNPRLSEPQSCTVHFFCKTLSASDVSSHGGLSIPKRDALRCLPRLDMSQNPPSQDLVATDLHGKEWHFRHIFRGQRHLLSKGWNLFVSSKRLAVGDVFIFLRGQNAELRVGVTRSMRQTNSTPSFDISSHSMLVGALTTAAQAIQSGAPFSVFYKPRTSPSALIERVNEDLEAPEGSRTIIGVEDIQSSYWLKVQSDEPPSILRPDKVSPGELKPISATNPSISDPALSSADTEKVPTPAPSQTAYLTCTSAGASATPLGAPEVDSPETISSFGSLSPLDKGKRVAESALGDVPSKRSARRQVIKPSTTHVLIDNVKEEEEQSGPIVEEQVKNTDFVPPDTLGASLSLAFGNNINVHSSSSYGADDPHIPGSSSDGSEKVMYESPLAFGGYQPGHYDEMAKRAQPSPSELSIDMDEIFKNMPEENAANGEEIAKAGFEAETATEVAIRPIGQEATRPASGGELGESSGKSFSVRSNNSENQKIGMLVERLRFFLGQWSKLEPQEFAGDSSCVENCLVSLRKEGVNVDTLAKYVGKLLDFGRQYGSACACSAEEQLRLEVQSLLKSLDEDSHAKTLELQSLQQEDIAKAHLKSELRVWKQEIKALQSKVRDREALLNSDNAISRTARINFLDRDLKEKAAARETLVAQRENATNGEAAKKAAALERLKAAALEGLKVQEQGESPALVMALTNVSTAATGVPAPRPQSDDLSQPVEAGVYSVEAGVYMAGILELQSPVGHLTAQFWN